MKASIHQPKMRNSNGETSNVKETLKQNKDGKVKRDKVDDDLGRNVIQIAETTDMSASDSKKKVMKRKRDKDLIVLEENHISGESCKMKNGDEVTGNASKKKKKVKRGKIDKERVDVLGNNKKDGIVLGMRFTPEEDKLVKDAVLSYIEEHDLGADGLNMVLNSMSHPEVRNCWREIASHLPWRPRTGVYNRAHILFERGKTRPWTPEEYKMVNKYYEESGPRWKRLAIEMGRSRFHVKDAWRRSKSVNRRRGRWSQEEYQTLFDLVNMDLRMKAFDSEPRRYKHGMRRDNISWSAIGEKMATRHMGLCCEKWYEQLSSPLVKEGLWNDSDDYRLLGALYRLDFCCYEDVEWEKLIENRCGDLCRIRWTQMARHLGEGATKPFVEQVEALSKRYCPDLLESKEIIDSLPVVP